MGEVILDVRELTTKYVTRFGENVYAVDHVSMEVEEGKSVGIAGRALRGAAAALQTRHRHLKGGGPQNA